MSFRRAAIARKTELRRTPFKRKPAAARSLKTIRRVKDTGPSRVVRRMVAARASWSCELCGCLLLEPWSGEPVTAHSIHHRQGRGMGGTSRVEVNSPANLMLLCGTGTTGCHGFVTEHPGSAYAEGWMVRRGTDPADVPAAIHGRPGLTLLTAAGEYEAAA